MNKGTAIIGISMLVALLVIAGANGSGFGEYASNNACHCLNFTVQLNHSGTKQWTLWNGDNYTLGFYVIPPSFNGMPNSPVLKFSTLNGFINASSDYTINITALIPYGTKLNQTWTGYAEAVSYIPNESSGGASVEVGTNKLLQVNSEPSTTSTTSTSTTSTSTATTIFVPQNTPGQISSSTITATTVSATSTIEVNSSTTIRQDSNVSGENSIVVQEPAASPFSFAILAIIVVAIIIVCIAGYAMWKRGAA